MRLLLCAMSGFVLATALVASCGDDGASGPSDSAATSSAPASTTPATGNAGSAPVSGSLELSGDLTGTFTWSSDLPVYPCDPLQFDVSLTDGKGTRADLTVVEHGGLVSLRSAKLDEAYGGTVGKLETTADELKSHLKGTATIDGTLTQRGGTGTITAKGTFTFACAH